MKSRKEIAHRIGNIALKAMLYEVSCTPKPGLVDRSNSGAHEDMDFFTFLDSSLVLEKHFKNMALVSSFTEDKNNLFSILRLLGKRAEEDMFKTTHEVNTQKGIIFSLGLFSSAAGYLLQKKEKLTPELLCNTVVEIIRNELLIKEFEEISVKPTHGEEVYKKYGIHGIRGEAIRGFPTVLNKGLPALKKGREYGNFNWAMVYALLNIMLVVEDTNVIYRIGLKEWQKLKEKVKEILEGGSVFTPVGKKRILDLDKEMIQMNVSPGGAADLLAVTLMIEFLTTELNI